MTMTQTTRRPFVLALLLLLAVSIPSAAGAAAQDKLGDDRSDRAMAETTFLNRSEEEYRDAIITAINDATIDAYVCQMIVQEWREQGQDYSDETFLEKLDSPEGRLERQQRLQYWLQERSKAKENSVKMDYKKYGAVVGAALVLLVLIIVVGAVAGKKKNEEPNPEKEQK